MLLMVDSMYAKLLFVGGTMVTMAHAWITSRYFQRTRSSSSSDPLASDVFNLTLWIATAVLSYQAGFYCAWSLTDYMQGQQEQLLLHFVLEVMCIAVTALCMWVMSMGRQPEDLEEASEPWMTLV